MPWSLVSVLFVLVSAATADNNPWPHAYDSTIIRTVRSSVFWQVSNDECTAVHAYNVSTGALNWERAPTDPDQTWSTQMTEKRTFYTLETGGPQVTAVSLDSGNVRWTWPDRVGPPFWKHWDTDLPQSAPLDTPLPAITVQQLLLRLKGTDTKLLGLNLYNGSVIWECDVAHNISTAAQVAGLQAPSNMTINSWLVGESGTVLYVSLTAQHSASGASPRLQSLLQQQSQQAAAAAATSDTATKHLSGKLHTQIGSLESQAAEDTQTGASTQGQLVQENTGQQQQGDRVAVGWVVALDLTSGSVQWVSGPLEQGPLSLTLTEPALLVISQPDEAGSGWLYGLHKDSGAALYSLPCAGGPCKVQVEDTHIGLLTASLLQQPPSLSSLAAFDLATGKELWRGVQGSKLQPLVTGQCTGLTDPTMVTYMACTCSAAQAVQAGFTAASGSAETTVLQQGSLDDDDASTASDSGMDRKHAGHHVKPSRPHPKPHPHPRPDPQPGPGLCGFAISTSTGKLVYEVLLSTTDQVPEDAALYGMKPFELADLMVFPGRKAIYAMQRLSVDPAPGVDSLVHDGMQHMSGHPSTQQAGTSAGVPDLLIAKDQPQVTARALSAHNTGVCAQQQGAVLPGAAACVSDGHAPQLQQQARLVFSFTLPVGVVLQPWDWLDLKSGMLVLRASAHFEGPPIPPADTMKSRRGQGGSGAARSVITPALGLDDSTPASANKQHTTQEAADSLGNISAAGAWDDTANTVARSLLGLGQYAAYPPGLTATRAGLFSSRYNKRRPSPDSQEDAPQTWLFAINPSNGSQLWSLTLDVWVPPLTQHVLPHEWGRGGLLLIDGCRPPDADTSLAGVGGDGTTCCLHAISLSDGKLQWQNCFDMDHACDSGMARRTATTIVYCLLAAQVLVLVLGFVLGVWWHLRMRRRPAATIMQDPDSEDEALIVQVLPAGYSISTSGRVS